jgi:hypothetical protein
MSRFAPSNATEDRRPGAESCGPNGRIRTLPARCLEECASAQGHARARQRAPANQVVGIDPADDDDIPLNDWLHGQLALHTETVSPRRRRVGLNLCGNSGKLSLFNVVSKVAAIAIRLELVEPALIESHGTIKADLFAGHANALAASRRWRAEIDVPREEWPPPTLDRRDQGVHD